MWWFLKKKIKLLIHKNKITNREIENENQIISNREVVGESQGCKEKFKHRRLYCVIL